MDHLAWPSCAAAPSPVKSGTSYRNMAFSASRGTSYCLTPRNQSLFRKPTRRSNPFQLSNLPFGLVVKDRTGRLFKYASNEFPSALTHATFRHALRVIGLWKMRETALYDAKKPEFPAKHNGINEITYFPSKYLSAQPWEQDPATLLPRFRAAEVSGWKGSARWRTIRLIPVPKGLGTHKKEATA